MQHPGEAAGAWKEKAEGETRRQGLGVPESLHVIRYLTDKPDSGERAECRLAVVRAEGQTTPVSRGRTFP